MLITLVTGKGSPGCSTSALALTAKWPRPALLAELDPRGGDVRLRYGQGARTDGRGLVLLHDEPRGSLAARLWDQVLTLDGFPDRWVLPGVEQPRQARSINWNKLADLIGEADGLGIDVIADCGSCWTEKPPRPVWQSAALAVLVIRPTIAGVHAASNAADSLVTDLETGGLGADRLVGLTVGGGSTVGPYPVKDVRDSLPDLPIPASLDWDPRGAAILEGLKSARGRESKLLRQAAKAALDLVAVAAHGRPDRPLSGPAFQVPVATPPAAPTYAAAVPAPLVDAAALGRHHDRGPGAPLTAPPVPSPPPRSAPPRAVESATPSPAAADPITWHPGAIPPAPPAATNNDTEGPA